MINPVLSNIELYSLAAAMSVELHHEQKLCALLLPALTLPLKWILQVK
jgi:hypothetical protein